MRADRVSSVFGGRRLNQDIGRGGEGCETSQLECNDDGESVGNPTTERDIGKFESTSSSGSSSSAADTTTRAAADQAAAPVCTSSAPSRTELEGVLTEDVLLRPQLVEQAGGLG